MQDSPPAGSRKQSQHLGKSSSNGGSSLQKGSGLRPAEIWGNDEFAFAYVDGWARLPSEVHLVECAGVAVDSKDNVYVLTRGDHPIVVLNSDGEVIRSFGYGNFSKRPHGIAITHDDVLLCVDDGLHTVQLFSTTGDLVLELGQRNQPAPKWSGRPFNQPTSAAVSPSTGEIYVTDGYGNSCVHVFSPSGTLRRSWGSPGIDRGQFIRPHNVVIDGEERIYVADRECHRVQVFDSDGRFITMWNNIYRPDAMTLGTDGYMYIGELTCTMAGLEDAPGLGHRVGVYDLRGSLVCRFGTEEEGDGPGQFIAPHGVAVDSMGSLYIAETSFTIRGSVMKPPREYRSLSKYARVRR